MATELDMDCRKGVVETHVGVVSYLPCRGQQGCCKCRKGRTFCYRGGWRAAEPQRGSSSTDGGHVRRSGINAIKEHQ